MADKKITQLDPLALAAPEDVFPIVDVDADVTLKITKEALMIRPGPIGTGVADVAEFTQITLSNPVNEFSIDGTLGGDSDSAIPTEKAVKSYVDTVHDIIPNLTSEPTGFPNITDSIIRPVDIYCQMGFFL